MWLYVVINIVLAKQGCVFAVFHISLHDILSGTDNSGLELKINTRFQDVYVMADKDISNPVGKFLKQYS